jgi:hypothetical protein
MEILNLRKIEKNIAVLWDGKDETLYYLNSDFISNINYEKKEEVESPTPEYYTIAKFEKQTDGSLLFTSQVYWDKSEIRLKTFEINDYIVLQHGNSLYDTPNITKIKKDDIILEYEIITGEFQKDPKELQAELEVALKNEDYVLAAQIRDIINKK